MTDGWLMDADCIHGVAWYDCAKCVEQTFCGCCGTLSKGEFCVKCRQHVLPINGNRHAWERTYFAQFGQDCPYQDPKEPHESITR